MKPFGFISPHKDPQAVAKNQQVLDLGTKFGQWFPTLQNATNFSAANSRAYWSLTGPLAYYWIVLAWDGVGAGIVIGNGGTPSYVDNCPFGPPYTSGLKSSNDVHYLEAVNYANYTEVLAGSKARLTYSGGVPRLNLPLGGAAITTPGSSILVYGHFLRD